MQIGKHARYGPLRSAVRVADLGMLALLSALCCAQTNRPPGILFVSNRVERFHLFIMNPDGSQQVGLTKGEAIEFDPVRSPDGKQIAFALDANPQELRSDIYVMHADGSRSTKLTQSQPNTYAFAPAWSPDSKRIVYSILEFGQSGKPPDFTLQLMDANGKNSKPLGRGVLPAWSPDGKKILYSLAGGPFPNLVMMDADGSNTKSLADKGMMGVWSPDGKRIAYIGEGESHQFALFVMNADGSEPTQLIKTPDHMELGPQWSADGKRLFFTRAERATADKQSQICVIDADGSNLKSLVDNASMNYTGNGMVILFLFERMQRRR